MSPDDRILISQCRIHITLISFFIILSLICAVVYLDIYYHGLSSTIYFRLTGYFIYPLFYGLAILVLWKLIKILLDSKNGFYFEGGYFHIPGRRPFKSSEIEAIDVSLSGYTENISIILSEGRVLTIQSYFFYETLNNVKEKIEGIKGNTFPK